MKCNCQEEASKQLRSKVVYFALSIKTKNSSTLEDYFISAEKKIYIRVQILGGRYARANPGTFFIDKTVNHRKIQ